MSHRSAVTLLVGVVPLMVSTAPRSASRSLVVRVRWLWFRPHPQQLAQRESPARHVRQHLHRRPFVDLYLIDILDRESAVGVNLLMGFQVHVATRRAS